MEPEHWAGTRGVGREWECEGVVEGEGCRNRREGGWILDDTGRGLGGGRWVCGLVGRLRDECGLGFGGGRCGEKTGSGFVYKAGKSFVGGGGL